MSKLEDNKLEDGIEIEDRERDEMTFEEEVQMEMDVLGVTENQARFMVSRRRGLVVGDCAELSERQAQEQQHELSTVSQAA